ncbi:TonB family protein [Hwanghaeella sp.]|uniref:energy transducer TonB n=1 Tax=Hwanghaeella sp. TaxID=2605943 RepID=UPI003CCC2545
MTHALPMPATADLDARHWLIAFGVAVAIHAAVFLQWPADEQAGAEAPGVGGISVSIAMTASLAGADQATPDPALAEEVSAQEATVTETVTADPVPVEPPVTPPVQEAVVEPSVEPVAEPIVEPTVEPTVQPTVEPVIEPAITETVPIEDVTPAEPIEPLPETVTVVEPPPEDVPVLEPVTEVATEAVVEEAPPPRPPIRPKTVEAKPVEPPVQPVPAVQPQIVEQPAPESVQATVPAAQPVQQTQPAETQSSHSSAAAVSSGQATDAPVGTATDSRNSTGGAAVSAPSPNYIAKLRLWLERHKDYPKLARRKRMQGVVLLYFRVGRDGSVMAQEIREGSGHTLLDDAALEMLVRAEPLPSFPQDMPGDYLDVVLPVEYSLRGNR